MFLRGMKKYRKFLLIGVAVLVMMQPVFAARNNDPVVMVPSKHKNLFVLKADRKFIGAKVEIVQLNGDVLSRQMLNRRKMIIDFGDVAEGSYVIRVSKNGRVEEFHYDKK